MATTRIKIDDTGKGILDLFASNMTELGELNKLADTGAGVAAYKGPDPLDPVHITQPRPANYKSLSRSPDQWESYWVREITFADDYNWATEGLISQAQNDDQGTSDQSFQKPDSDTVAVFQGKSSTNLLNKYGAYNDETGAAEPQNFMKLKGRKGLFTLLGETMEAFFDSSGKPVYRETGRGAGERSLSNRYFAGEKSYDFIYLNTQGTSFVDPPTDKDIANQNINRFALGQLYGGAETTTVIDQIRSESQQIMADYFNDLIDQYGEGEPGEDDVLSSFYTNLLGLLAPTERISQLYVPGWGRPQENYLTKKPLSENLNQNLLLPPSSDSLGVTNPLRMPGNSTGNGEGIPGYGDTAATFQSLYTRNRAGAAGGVNVSNYVFNNGTIAGTAINLLQEPSVNRTSDVITGTTNPANIDYVPFTFEQDDAQYLTYDKRVAGFTSNGPNVGSQPAKMEPAVKEHNPMETGDHALETVAMSQGQYFPFVFSTINKKDNGWQTCFLQATLNSLSESYNPTWQSKHFFGRSEQVHTYTFTDRNIDLSFTIFANEMRQLQNVYERVLWLAQQCYPDFDNTGRMSQGPIIAVRVGDLFQFKRGIIRSLSYDWFGVGGGKWEMTSGMRMPQGCTVTMSYQIMHNDIPSRDFDFYGGPAGGLNAATQRWRRLAGDNTGGTGDGAFGDFEDELTVSSVGYGSGTESGGRLIDAGTVDATYLDTVEDANYAHADAGGALVAGMDFSSFSSGSIKDVLNVPVGIDEEGDVINSETYESS